MVEKNNNQIKKINKDIEVITGNGKNLNISPVYDHIKITKPINNKDKNKKILIPKSQKKDTNS